MEKTGRIDDMICYINVGAYNRLQIVCKGTQIKHVQKTYKHPTSSSGLIQVKGTPTAIKLDPTQKSRGVSDILFSR